MLPASTPVIVLHDSLLPCYRGFAPLVNMLLNAEPELGVTALMATQKYDDGPILEQASVPVDYPLKIQGAIQCLLPLYAQLVVQVCSRALAGECMAGAAQDTASATYSPWRDALDYAIPWGKEASRIRRFVDALGAPYLGAVAYCGAKKLIIYEVVEEPDVVVESREEHIGKVLFREGDTPIVICGTGLLRIKRACYEGSAVNCVSEIAFRSRFTTQPIVL
jgi:methionyl-tRNA formyltransferase